jgi:hypothetical protein
MTPRRRRIALGIGLSGLALLAMILFLLRQGDPPPFPAVPDLSDLEDGQHAAPEPPRTPRAARLPAPWPPEPPAATAHVALPPGTPRLQDHLPNPVAAPRSAPGAIGPRAGRAHPPDGAPADPSQAMAARPGSDPELAAALAEPGNPNRWTALADRFRVHGLHDLEAAALRRALRVPHDPSMTELLRNRVRQADADARTGASRSTPIEFPPPANP